MIKSVRANKGSFRTVKFDPGFNVVLAEKSKNSSEKESRNGLGKSTLVEIIHFCLGSILKKEDRLSSEELKGWVFFLDLEINGESYTFSRNTSENNKKIFIEGDTSDWLIQPDISKQGTKSISVKGLSQNLTYLGFNIDPFSKNKYQPSSRMLFSHLIRRGVSGFSDPFAYFPQEKSPNKQVNNAYLLNLNWEVASELHEIKDKEKALKNFKSALSKGLVPGMEPSLGELEADAVVMEEEVDSFETQMKTFKVHPQYYDLEKNANDITKKIHELTNELTIKQQSLSKYKDVIEKEHDEDKADFAEINKVYKEAGFVFPEQLNKTIEEVEKFHEELISNRKDYLEIEIEKNSNKIEKVKIKIKELSDERAGLLAVLKTHNALDEYYLLQERVIEKRQKLLSLRHSIKQLIDVEKQKSRLTIHKEQVIEVARQDLLERENLLKKSLSFFNRNSLYLYSEGGRLTVDITKNGYKFNVEIKRSGSQGIGYMKVFCYDLTIMQLNSLNSNFFKTLVHDSTIFDGVDERQIAKGLELAYNESEDKGFQYICTMNSDVVPFGQFSESFDKKFKESIKIVLRDGNEKDSLLGFRF